MVLRNAEQFSAANTVSSSTARTSCTSSSTFTYARSVSSISFAVRSLRADLAVFFAVLKAAVFSIERVVGGVAKRMDLCEVRKGSRSRKIFASFPDPKGASLAGSRPGCMCVGPKRIDSSVNATDVGLLVPAVCCCRMEGGSDARLILLRTRIRRPMPGGDGLIKTGIRSRGEFSASRPSRLAFKLRAGGDGGPRAAANLPENDDSTGMLVRRARVLALCGVALPVDVFTKTSPAGLTDCSVALNTIVPPSKC